METTSSCTDRRMVPVEDGGSLPEVVLPSRPAATIKHEAATFQDMISPVMQGIVDNAAREKGGRVQSGLGAFSPPPPPRRLQKRPTAEHPPPSLVLHLQQHEQQQQQQQQQRERGARGHRRLLPSDASSASSTLSLATMTTASTSASLLSCSPPPPSSALSWALSSALSPTSSSTTDCSSLRHENHNGLFPHSPGCWMGHSPRSRTSLDSPITPASLDDAASAFALHLSPGSSPPPPDAHQEHDQMRTLIKSLPLRPKGRKHRESWDSGVGSDLYGHRTRGNSFSTDELSIAARLRHDATEPTPPSVPAAAPQVAASASFVSRVQARLSADVRLLAHARRLSRGSHGSISSPPPTTIIAPRPQGPFVGPFVRDDDAMFLPHTARLQAHEDDMTLDDGPIVAQVASAQASWDEETGSETTMSAEDDAGRILNYALDVAFGLAPSEVDVPLCRSVVHNFISDLEWALGQRSSEVQEEEHEEEEEEEETEPRLMVKTEESEEELCDAERRHHGGNGHQPPRTASSASNGTRLSQGSSSSRGGGGGGKRKSRSSGGSGGGDDDGQDGGEDGMGDGNTPQREPGPSKRARVETAGVRMSCPYRKKNPLRFNVRAHRACALTVFDDLAELRRHINTCHRRPAQSPHRCPRCQVQFVSEHDWTEHMKHRSGILCPLVENPSSLSFSSSFSSQQQHNPEDGIDEATADRLRSKKGRVSDPPEVQWQKIWELCFPGWQGPPLPFDYCAVMEHHELHEKLRASMPLLRGTLARVGFGKNGLDTLEGILSNHFIGLLEQCNAEGRMMEYSNRPAKGGSRVVVQSQQQAPVVPAVVPSQQQTPLLVSVGNAQLRKHASLRQRLDARKHDRDSGFVDGDDSVQDASEGLSTPALTSDEGGSPPGLGLMSKQPFHHAQTTTPILVPQSQPQPLPLHNSAVAYGFPPGGDKLGLPPNTNVAEPVAAAAASAATFSGAGTFTTTPFFPMYSDPYDAAAAASAAALPHCAAPPPLPYASPAAAAVTVPYGVVGSSSSGGGANGAWGMAAFPDVVGDHAITAWLNNQSPPRQQ